MTVLLDNKGQGKVGDALGKSIQADARLSVVSGLFSIYGYAVLKNQLAQIDSLRLLIPSNDAGSMLPSEKQPLQVAGIAGDEGDRRFRNSLNLTEIARECAESGTDLDVVPLERVAITAESIVALAMLRMSHDEPDPAVTELEKVLGHVIRSFRIAHRDPREAVKGSLRNADTGDVVLEQDLVEALHV